MLNRELVNNKFKALELIFKHSRNTGLSLDESYDELVRMYRKVFPTSVDKEMLQEDISKS
jgi:hypothetical protein